MQAEYKLEEARYFLRRLNDLRRLSDVTQTSNEPEANQETFDEIMYTLSAFVSAWRSVFDVLLYDYAEKYFEFNREQKVTPGIFSRAIKVYDFPEAKEFIEWYNETEEDNLRGNPLWKLGVFFIHRGFLDRHKMGSSRICFTF